jgi:hypothetical protein
MGSLFGFRFALGLIAVTVMILAAALGGAVGYVGGAYWYSDPVGGAIAGGLVGAIVGWIFAAFATGIGQALLSINDHLAAIRKHLEQAKDAEPPARTARRPARERIVPVFSIRKNGDTPDA